MPELIVVGKLKIAEKLMDLATVADFKVTLMAKSIQSEVTFEGMKNLKNKYVVIASQGEADEENVFKALQTSIDYIGLISSAKKVKKIKTFLATTELSSDRINELRSPVGIDINAKQASEVAISILADIIQEYRKKPPQSCCDTPTGNCDKEENSKAFNEEFYINPVCNVPISKKSPKHILEYLGNKVFFCCDGCKLSFEKNPEQYLQSK